MSAKRSDQDRDVTRRDGKMVKRWTAAGLEVAEKQFRRVNGYSA